MIAAWMLYVSVIAALLAIAALAAERVRQSQRRSTRWVWLAAMLAPVLMAMVAPTADIETLAPQAAKTAERALTQSQPSLLIAQRTAWSGREALERMIPPAHRARWDDALTAVWLSGSLATALFIMMSWRRLTRRSHRWTPARVAGQSVFVSDDTGPAVFGVRRPQIVVPRWLAEADSATQRAAIAHEREHIAARDTQLGALALILLVLMPWNAPLWWAWRRLRAAIEIDCDARVLSDGGEPAQYGAALLAVAERRPGSPALSPAMHDSSRALEHRLRLLFPSRRRSRLLMIVLGGVAATLTAAAAQIDPPGAGADANQVVLGDGSPLIIAARRGNLPLVELLLSRGANPDLAVAGDGNPLIMAAAHGHEAIVALLLERRADVNAVVIGDETPLINAARAGHLSIVRTLVERGADVALAVPADRTPWAEIRSPESEARKYGRREVLEYLRGPLAAARKREQV